jgi:hypothetical protein
VPRSRSVQQREKDNRALDLRRRGFRYDQIASQMGFRSKASAHQAVQRALAENAQEASAEVRQMELDRLDDLARPLHVVLARPHYAFTQSGKLITRTDPATGVESPVLDDNPVIAAVGQLLRISESRRRLLGLDAPTRSRVEVVTPEMIEEQIAEMERKIRESAGQVPQPVQPARPVLQLTAEPADPVDPAPAGPAGSSPAS